MVAVGLLTNVTLVFTLVKANSNVVTQLVSIMQRRRVGSH